MAYFGSVAPPPFGPPLLSGLLVSFPGVSVSLLFFPFLFITGCSLFVFLFNSNPFIIDFSIFQFAILSKRVNRISR